MKIFIPAIFFILFSFHLYSQNLAKNTIYFELGGAALLGSLNYERLVLNNDNHNLGIRAGIIYINSFSGGERLIFGIPFGFSYLLSGKKLCFETGPSFIIGKDKFKPSPYPPDTNYRDYLLGLRMGIRNQPVKRGIFWNALIQSSWAINEDLNYPNYNSRKYSQLSAFPWISLGIGYAF